MTEGILGLIIILGIIAVCSFGGIISRIRGGEFFDGAGATLIGGAIIFLIVTFIITVVETWKVPL